MPSQLLHDLQLWLQQAKPQSIKDTALWDQHHIGGLSATRALFDHITALDDTARALDIGCGFGGAARYTAAAFDIHVTGIDIDPLACDAATAISAALNMTQQTTFLAQDATKIRFTTPFDLAYTMHSTMPIADKKQLYARIYNALKPNGLLALYEIYKTDKKDAAIPYPMPWAQHEEQSHLESFENCLSDLKNNGFQIEYTENRQAFAREKTNQAIKFLSTHKDAANITQKILGANYLQRLENIHAAIENDLCNPYIVIARKSSSHGLESEELHARRPEQ